MTRVLTAAGARDTEELLLTELDEDQARVAADPTLLARALHIVVPSRSLRDHLNAKISARRTAVAGVLVETHLQLAYRVLRELGDATARTQDPILELLIRRHAEADPVLREALGDLQLGYRSVSASAVDLLHADLGVDQGEALEAAVAELGQGERSLRTAAIVRATLRALQDFDARGYLTRDDQLRDAGERLRESGVESLGRGVIVHGFADATGVVSAFLELLLKHPQALLLLDRPRDPADLDREDLGVEFSRPFGQRLGETSRSSAGGDPSATTPEFFTAPGSRAEARELARRIRALLDLEDAPTPESIAVVARSWGPRLLDLRESFEEYGIPWQAPAAKESVDPVGRRLLALRELLRRGGRCTLERWLEARGEEFSGWRSRLAFSVLGVARLAQLPELDYRPALHHGRLRLPHRRGFFVPEDSAPSAASSKREQFPASALDELQADARRLLERIASLDTTQSFAAHAATTLVIAREDLGWVDGEEDSPAMLRWKELLQDYPADFELRGEEFLSLLHEAIDRAARGRPPRPGGGVRVLDLTQARALSFEHIFVIGLNRGVFPPAAREDPLLPDAVRVRLRAVLPELKSKLDRAREERFLFAQLLSAAASSITLSWWSSDDDGRAAPPSPFVQRLRLGEQNPPPSAPAVLEIEIDPVGPRPLTEQLMEAALERDQDRFVVLLANRMQVEDGNGRSAEHSRQMAEAALRVLHEYDLAPGEAPDLGPWMGWVPPRRDGLVDPRAQNFYVTSLEHLAGCPWSWFLQKVLGLEAMPDPLDSLPALDPRQVGSAVHGTLERIIEFVTGPSEDRRLAQLEGPGRHVPWPDTRQLESWSLQAAETVLLDEGLVLPGLARALSIRAGVYLQECRDLLFTSGSPLALGSEIRDEARVMLAEGHEARIPFRTDLVDRADGRLRLLDFKTGASFAQAVTKKRERVLDALASGSHLQGMAYALAAAQVEGSGTGAYLFLKPKEDPRTRLVELPSDDPEMVDRFLTVVSLLDRAKQRGLLFPRLIELKSGNEPSRCNYCEVSGACVRGDTQKRQRESEWFDGLRARADDGQALTADEASLLQLWNLSGRPS